MRCGWCGRELVLGIAVRLSAVWVCGRQECLTESDTFLDEMMFTLWRRASRNSIPKSVERLREDRAWNVKILTLRDGAEGDDAVWLVWL